MLKNVPQSRLIVYIMLSALLPIILTLFNLMNKKGAIEETMMTVERLQHEALIREEQQAANRAVVETFRETDHFYIDKHLETITLRKEEIEGLEKVIKDTNFAGDEMVTKRLSFLKGPGNKPLFSEGVVQLYSFFQESTETLVNPVEVNIEDVKKILAVLEGTEFSNHKPAPNRPQIIITDFSLNRKKINDNNDVFVLNLKILKREFL